MSHAPDPEPRGRLSSGFTITLRVKSKAGINENAVLLSRVHGNEPQRIAYPNPSPPLFRRVCPMGGGDEITGSGIARAFLVSLDR